MGLICADMERMCWKPTKMRTGSALCAARSVTVVSVARNEAGPQPVLFTEEFVPCLFLTMYFNYVSGLVPQGLSSVPWSSC